MGQNLAYVSNSALNTEGAIIQSIQGWAEEAAYYNLEQNSCVAPEGDSCGHYTQVVWDSSVKVQNTRNKSCM